MSKVFSISLATVLMLINIVGPMQPASVMDDTPQETTPIVDEMLLDDASDSDEAVIEASESVEPPPAENDEIVAEEEDVSPVEEPAEQSNSPPAEEVHQMENEPAADKVETDDATGPIDNTDNMLISPNAVDPDPGDCPIGGTCDGGGGGETPSTVMFTITVRTDPFGTGLIAPIPLQDASVSITNSNNELLGDRLTNDQGIAQFELAYGQTFTVAISKSGHVTQSGLSITALPNSNDLFVHLSYTPGTMTFNVTDYVSGLPVAGALVEIKRGVDPNVLDSGETDVHGVRTTGELARGEYHAQISANGYMNQTVYFTMSATGTTEVKLYPVAASSPLTLEIVDAVTGAPVADAEILLMNASTWAWVGQGKSSAQGTWTSASLPAGTYAVHIESGQYAEYNNESIQHPAGTPVRVELQPLVAGRITVNVLDRETGDPIPNAYVTVMESWTGDEGAQVAFGRSDSAGQWTSPELPGDLYFISAMVEGYLQNFGAVYTVDANVSVDIELELVNDAGLMQLTVYDESTGRRLSGVNITVRSEGVVGIGRTDSDGVWSTAPLGRGTYEFTLERTGFRTQTFKHVHGGGDEFLDVNMQHVSRVKFRIGILMPRYAFPDWSATRLVSANGMMIGQAAPVAFQVDDEILPVTGATVRLLDPDTLEVIAEEISDDQGFVEFDVPEGNYILQITGEGFQEYSQPVTLAEDLEIDLVLEPLQVDDPNPPGDGEPGDGEPGDGEPGDGEPGDGEPGDGEPGDGEPGDGEPGDGEPGDGEPGGGEPGDGEPGDGEPGDGSNPDTGNPGEGTTPGTEDPDDGSNPGTGEEEAGVDNDVAESGEATNADAVAQSSGSSTDAPSGDVNQLPNTGAGESKPNVFYAALTLVAAFFLLGALGVRRSTR